MKRKKLVSVVGSMVIAAMGLSPNVCAATVKSDTTTRVSVHDPSVVKDKGNYYVFGSHIEAARSTDLQNWTRFTNGYDTPNNVLFGDLSSNLAGSFAWAGENDVDSSGGFSVWAPDVFWNENYVNKDGSKGAYMMYYCTSSTYKRSCIGYGVSDKIEGPYTYVDTIMYSGFTKGDAYDSGSLINTKYTNTNLSELIEAGTVSGTNGSWFTSNGGYNTSYAPNAIDPALFYDEDGRLWMTYGSWSGGIFLLEINPETGEAIYPGSNGKTEGGNRIDQYFGVHIAGGYTKSGEGPYIVYDEATNYYYLYMTYASLNADGGYNMRLFRSENPDGPYVDAMGNDAVLPGKVDHTYAGIKLMGNYMLNCLYTGYKAEGHNSAFIDDDGDRYLVYHTRFNGGTEEHQVRVHQQFMNEAGWPVVAVYENRGDEISKTGYARDEVVGCYQYINHGTDDGTKMITTQRIFLNEDHSISGDVTGSWEAIEGTYYANFKIDEVSYEGVFFKQSDESEEANEVMTFTAIGENNTCIWGSQIGADDVIYNENRVKVLSDTLLEDNGIYTLQNVYTKLYLDTEETQSETTNMQQWEAKTTTSQQLALVATEDGYYQLLTASSGYTQAVGVENGNGAAGANVVATDNVNSEAQQFKITRNEDGSYSLLSRCSGDTTCLEVYNFGMTNGCNISTWTYWGGDLQHWLFTKVGEREALPKVDINVDTYAASGLNQSYSLQVTEGQVDLSQLAIRYYFTKTDAATMNVWCDHAALQLNVNPWYMGLGSKLQTKLVPTETGYYLELTVADNTVLEANTGSLVVATRLSNEDWSGMEGFEETGVEVLYQGQVMTRK